MDLSLNGDRPEDIPGSSVESMLAKIHGDIQHCATKTRRRLNHSNNPLLHVQESNDRPTSPASDRSSDSAESVSPEGPGESSVLDRHASGAVSRNLAESLNSYNCLKSPLSDTRANSSASVSCDDGPELETFIGDPKTLDVCEASQDPVPVKRMKRQASPLPPSTSRVLRFRSSSIAVGSGVRPVVDWNCDKEGSSNNEEGEQHQVSKSKRKSSKPRKLKITIKKDGDATAEITGFEIEDGNVLVKIEEDSTAEDQQSTDREDSDEDYRQNYRRKRSSRGKRKRVKKSTVKSAVTTVKKAARVNAENSPKQQPPKKKKKKRRDIAMSSCKVCGRTFRNFYMATHMRTHTGEKPYACNECEKHFSTECYLKMHKQSCHEDPQAFQCDICHRNLASKGSLREHKRTHSDERPFQCHICQKVFRQPALLINHIKTHSDLTPYQCELCGNRYKYKRSMEMHKERIHDGIRKSFPCTICGKVFTRKTKLKDHTNWHLGKSPHLCEHCGKRFLSRKTLRTHLLIHEDKKPYPCDVCGKAFRQAHVLKRHQTTHTGIKPFRCDACGKQFIHRVYLVRHDCPQAKNKLLESSIPKIDCLPVLQQVPQEFVPLPVPVPLPDMSII